MSVGLSCLPFGNDRFPSSAWKTAALSIRCQSEKLILRSSGKSVKKQGMSLMRVKVMVKVKKTAAHKAWCIVTEAFFCLQCTNKRINSNLTLIFDLYYICQNCFHIKMFILKSSVQKCAIKFPDFNPCCFCYLWTLVVLQSSFDLLL